jgi:hypothetical protein
MAITAGSLLNSVAASMKMTLSTNYVDFTSTATQGWAQQYLPDLMEKEAEVFGNRTISGFLSQVGAEEAMTSDQVVWSEQGRLHISLRGTTDVSADTFTVTDDIDGNTTGGGSNFVVANHGVRINDMVLISQSTGSMMCMVTQVNGATITAKPYDQTVMTSTLVSDSATGAARLLVVGSEYAKGSKGQGSQSPTSGGKSNEPTFKSFTNKPIIIKDYYEINGSDTAQIGWVEVSGEDGQSGYLWYLKAEGETRMRFTDYLEMSMLEAVLGTTSPNSPIDAATTLETSMQNPFGTEGLFAAVASRGNVSTGITGVTAATDLAEFDAILAEFDKQGAIEENMLFANRTTSLAVDDMLASMNSYGAGGTSFGVFNNSEDMALNLGFSGFRRGSYDFYKSDFRYLNDRATRGGANDINTTDPVRGIFIPAGTSTVYDQQLGKNLKRPFLHVRYRASQTDDRRLKTWVTGSVGAATSDLDAMQINYLSERCLITQGANNFMLLK